MEKIKKAVEIKMAYTWIKSKKAIMNYPFNSYADIRNDQLCKIKELLFDAYNNVPFYNNFYKAHNIHPSDIQTWDDFLRIPTISKKDLCMHEDEFINHRFPKNQLIKSSTSGSSGQYTTIYLDPNMFAIEERQVIRMIREAYPNYKAYEKEVLVYTSEYPVDSMLGFFKVYYVNNLEPIRNILNFILEVKPTVLAVYPSILRELIRLDVTAMRSIGLKLIITNSEQSTQQERNYFQNILNCRIMDEFSSEELQSIAYQCSENQYHEVSDCSYIELLETKNDKPVAIGEIGEIVGTCLINPAMPLIRYRQGDFALKKDGICSCGKHTTIIGNPIGRINDSFLLEDGTTIPSGKVLDWAYSLVLKYNFPIKEYQIIQRDFDNVDIYFVSDSTFSVDTIKQCFEESFGKIFRVNIYFVDFIPKTSSGKFAPIKSMIV